MRMHLLPIMIVLSCCIFFAGNNRLSPYVQAAEPVKVVEPVNHAARYEKLVSTAQQAGEVRVIVSLQVQPEPTQTGTPPEAQRARIAQTQETLLQRLTTSLDDDLSSHFTVEHQYTTTPGMVLTVDEKGLQELLNAPEVAAISEDLPLPPALSQSIPLIGADYAWEQGHDGQGWNIAVLDTGVDASHPFFQNRVVAEACFSTTRGDHITTLCPNGELQQTGSGAGVNCDETVFGCFHGTHVAGIAAGRGDEFSGVAQGAGILPVQVFSSFDDDNYCNAESPCILSYQSDQIRALEWVYEQRNEHQIAAVNLSLGGGTYASASACNEVIPAYTQAVENLVAANIAVVASAGNQGSAEFITYPACLSDVVAVGATDTNDTIGSFSNSNALVDMLAPGVHITSSVPDNEFDAVSGTSMAAPHVAGAWAVLKSQEPSASVETLRARLTTTGIPINDTRNNQTFPRLDLYNALRGEADPPLVLQAVTTPETVAPGQILSYTFTIRNDKTNTVTQVSLASEIPQGATLITASDGGIEQDGAVIWEKLKIEGKGGEVERTMQVAVSPSVLSAAQATLNSTVSLTHKETVIRQVVETPVVGDGPPAHPSLALDHTTNLSTVQPGQTIVSTYRMTNTGDIALSGIAISNNQGVTLTPEPSELAPSQHLMGTIYTAIGEDNEPGPLEVIITVQAFSPDQTVVTAQASHTVTVQDDPPPERPDPDGSYTLHLPHIELAPDSAE